MAITLNGAAGTITWTMDAARTAELPLGRVMVNLLVWTAGPASHALAGPLAVLDPSTSATTTASLTNAAGWTATLTPGECTQGESYGGTFTVRDENGALVDLTGAYASIRLDYSPEGSTTPIPETRAPVTTLYGTIYYDLLDGTGPHIYVGATIKLMVGVWPSGVLYGTVVTGPTGGYTFTGFTGGTVYLVLPAGSYPPGLPVWTTPIDLPSMDTTAPALATTQYDWTAVFGGT